MANTYVIFFCNITLFIYSGLSNVLHILRMFLMIFTKYIDIHYDNNIKYTNKTCVYNQNLLLFVMYVCMCLNKLALSFVSNIDVPCKIIFVSVPLPCVLWTFTTTPMGWSGQPNCLIRVPLMAVLCGQSMKKWTSSSFGAPHLEQVQFSMKL